MADNEEIEAEAPLTKTKETKNTKTNWSKAFEKVKEKRRANIESKKQEKLLNSAKLLVEEQAKQQASLKPIEKVNNKSDEEEIIVVKSKSKPKPKKKIIIVEFVKWYSSTSTYNTQGLQTAGLTLKYLYNQSSPASLSNNNYDHNSSHYSNINWWYGIISNYFDGNLKVLLKLKKYQIFDISLVSCKQETQPKKNGLSTATMVQKI